MKENKYDWNLLMRGVAAGTAINATIYSAAVGSYLWSGSIVPTIGIALANVALSAWIQRASFVKRVNYPVLTDEQQQAFLDEHCSKCPLCGGVKVKEF